MYKVKKNNFGFLNEVAFAKALNNKMYNKLSKDFQEMLKAIYFNVNVNENDIVQCWKSRYKEKADIKIKINGIVKGISIKCGNSNSVHLEELNSFIKFLTSLGVTDKTIKNFKSYIIGKINDTIVDNKTYKQFYEKNLLLINRELNDFYVKTNIIIRSLFKGAEINRYNADAIIQGTPDSFIWATKSEILKYLMYCDNRANAAVSVSSLNIQSWDKTLTSKQEKLYVQIKWHIIKKDLVEIISKRKSTI